MTHSLTYAAASHIREIYSANTYKHPLSEKKGAKISLALVLKALLTSRRHPSVSIATTQQSMESDFKSMLLKSMLTVLSCNHRGQVPAVNTANHG